MVSIALFSCGPVSPIVVDNDQIAFFLNDESMLSDEDLDFDWLEDDSFLKKVLKDQKVEFKIKNPTVSSDTVGLTIKADFQVFYKKSDKLLADGNFQLFGTPYLDKNKGKVYVKNTKVEKLMIGEKKVFLNKGIISKGIETGMSNYPLYKFDDKNWIEKIIKNNLQDLKTDARGVLIYF